MAKVIKRTLVNGDEYYYVRKLFLPDYYKIIHNELNIPNSWNGQAPGILRDKKFQHDMKKGQGENYYNKVNFSLNSNYILQKLLLDVIGYTHTKKPEDYNNDKEKKSSMWGGMEYYGYGNSARKVSPKKKGKPEDKIIRNRYTEFVSIPTYLPIPSKEVEIEDKEGTYSPPIAFSYPDSSPPYEGAKIINPIYNELKLLNIKSYSDTIFQEHKDGKVSQHIIDFIRAVMPGALSKNHANDEEKDKEIENLINSPLLSSNFYANMTPIQIPYRPYHRYVNRHIDRELENCVIPGKSPFTIEFPKEPFIFIVNQRDVNLIFEETNETKIYIIIGEMSKKDYYANVVKTPKGDYYKTHYFKQRKNYLERNPGTLFSDRIFMGLEVIMSQNQGDNAYNHFGPLENTLHPEHLRSIITDYNNEEEAEEEFPCRNLNFAYKIITLKDIAPKIVNWPRSKPIKDE